MIYGTVESENKTFEQNFIHSINHQYRSKFLLHGEVGIGKTKLLKEIHKFTSEDVVICFPTHDLKEEFCSNLKYPHVMTPRPTKGHQNDIQRLEKVYSNVSTIHWNLRGLYSDFYNKLYTSIAFPGTVVTTHDAYLCSPERFNQRLIIFDEVPDNLFGHVQNESFMGVYELEYLNFSKKTEWVNEIDFYTRLLKLKIEEVNPNRTGVGNFIIEFDNPFPEDLRKHLFKITDKRKNEIDYKNITRVLQSNRLVVSFLNNRLYSKEMFRFNHLSKYLCFSATPNDVIFEHQGFETLRTKPLAPKGEIINIAMATSKQALKNPETIKQINHLIQKLKLRVVLTYKEHIKTIHNASDEIYFGNLKGTNRLMYQDKIGVVGTPMNNVQYFHDLVILCEQHQIRPDDFTMTDKKIYIDSKEVFVHTFRDNWLTHQHINQVQSEMIQALGRIRPYSRDCIVYVFSKLPFRATRIIDPSEV